MRNIPTQDEELWLHLSDFFCYTTTRKHEALKPVVQAALAALYWYIMNIAAEVLEIERPQIEIQYHTNSYQIASLFQ